MPKGRLIISILNHLFLIQLNKFSDSITPKYEKYSASIEREISIYSQKASPILWGFRRYNIFVVIASSTSIVLYYLVHFVFVLVATVSSTSISFGCYNLVHF